MACCRSDESRRTETADTAKRLSLRRIQADRFEIRAGFPAPYKEEAASTRRPCAAASPLPIMALSKPIPLPGISSCPQPCECLYP